MGEEEGSSNVRLVRCPKCNNLLPESTSYSVYKCGACGALLRAKKKVAVNGGLLGKERDGEGFEKLESMSVKEEGSSNLGNASEVEGERRDGLFLENGGKERVFDERTFNLVSNYKEASADNSKGIVKEQTAGYQSGAEKRVGYNEKNRAPMKHSVHNWVGQDDKEMNMNRSESVGPYRDKYSGKFSAQSKASVGSLRSRDVVGKRGLDGNGVFEVRGLEVPHENLVMSDHPSRFSKFAPYPDEGPSKYSYMKSSSDRRGQLLKNFDDPDGSHRFALLERDRAELLMKLNELKDQIYRSSSVAEKQRDVAAVNVNVAPSGVYNHDRVPYNVPAKPLAPDKHVQRSPYFWQNDYEHVGASNQDMNRQNFYFPQKHNANGISVYKDPIQMPRLDSHQPPGHFLQQRHPDYHIGTRKDFDREHFTSYTHGTLYHEPACACSHCYKKKFHVASEASSVFLGHKHFVEEPIDSNFNYHVNAIKHGSQNCTSRVNHHALLSRDTRSHARWPRDIDSDMDVLRQSRPRRMVMVKHGNGRFCHPIAGGAPIILCCKCFELLKLPRKLKSREKNQQKLQCGACSTVFLVEIRNKKLIISVPVENKQILAEASDGSCEVSKEVLLNPERDLSGEGTKCSVDFDKLNCDPQSAGIKGNLLPEDQMLNLNESTTKHGVTSVCSVSSEEGETTDSMVVRKDVSDFPELPKTDNASPTFLNTPFLEHSDDVSSNCEISRVVEGNKSNRIDNEKFILDKGTSLQNSVDDAQSETEVEVSFNEFINTSGSHDSFEVSREDLPPRINKGSESFLVGFLKKSIRDFSRSNQQYEDKKPKVFVNGKPILDDMVKRAEKLAGPILPGNYWYDSQAGFWGVMGEPCVGIIPPCIKEFNYPMPENCSSGDTGIFVNGRELHQKDLELLVTRGLPMTKKSYIVEISGRIYEKDTGNELKRLGRLAPTVEKMKRGFGMKVPRKLI